MTFVPETWTNDGGKKLNAAELNDLETRIADGFAPLDPVTKKATITLSGDGTGTNTATVRETTQRQLVAFPVTTKRWRLRIRNYSNQQEAVGSGSLRLRGMAIATPSYTDVDSTSASAQRWKGRLGADAQATVAAATLPSDASDYTSEWISDPSLQFPAGEVKAVSIGIDTDGAGKNFYREVRGQCWVSSGGGAAELWADTGSTAAGAWVSTTYSRLWMCDCRIEYEYEDSASNPRTVVAFIGDSIMSGAVVQGTQALNNHESWPMAAALRNGIIPINMGVGSSLASDWDNNTGWKWDRFDLTTTPPDLVVVGPGYNDVSGGVTSANLISYLSTIITNCRGRGWDDVALATIIPGNFVATGGNPEAQRVAVNTWMRDMPLGVRHVFDLDKAVSLQATPQAPDTAFINTAVDLHPKPGGHQRLAQAFSVGRRR